MARRRRLMADAQIYHHLTCRLRPAAAADAAQ